MASESIGHFIRFCNDANIDFRQFSDSLRKYVLTYQRNLERKNAFTVLFRDGFINWEYIERGLPRMDAAHWINVFQYFDFSKVNVEERSMLRSIQQHLKTMDLDTDLNFACRVFLLTNINHITSQLGLERLFCEHNIPDAYNKSMRFFALGADTAFDRVETTAVFCHIMLMSVVDEAEIDKQIQFVMLREEELSNSFKVKQLRAMNGRPRLRSKLADVKRDIMSIEDMDDFDKWNRVVKFPSVFSLHIKQRLYFLMSQTHIPNQLDHVHRITTDSYVRNALKLAEVKKPDVDIICRVISSLRIIDEPFTELHDFRADCTGAFPMSQLGVMKLNDILHMYVCAYQNPLVWKEVWKRVAPMLSHQVIRDVESFTFKRPFNFEAVLGIMSRG